MKKNRTRIASARALRRRQTGAERALWTRLRNRRLGGLRFRRQHPIGPYVVDFVCPEKRLIVEVDGGGHNRDDRAARDEMRTIWLEDAGYTVVRFWNNEVLVNLDGVMEGIGQALGDVSPSP